MIYLVLSVLSSSVLYIIFKLFTRYEVNNLHAITINYWTAFSLGFILAPVKIPLEELPQEPWFFYALGLGLLFISVFTIMAYTSQQNGVSIASTVSKMSVIIPVTAGIILYQESSDLLKIIGIAVALVAVYLTTSQNQFSESRRSWLFPLLLFIGSGIIDTSIKYVETHYVSTTSTALFSAILFLFAGIFGLIFIVLTRKIKLKRASVVGGIVLGIPNYFSIYFLIKTLSTPGIESSTAFTIINVAIVALSTFFGLVIFKEKLSTKNKWGIVLALLSIYIVAYF